MPASEFPMPLSSCQCNNVSYSSVNYIRNFAFIRVVHPNCKLWMHSKMITGGTMALRRLAKYVRSPLCTRDTKIICQDGEVLWNRLFLISWSPLLREFDKGTYCGCGNEPLVIMLPDFKLEIVKLMLQWSSYGEVSLRAEQCKPLGWLLEDLGVPKDFTSWKQMVQPPLACVHCGQDFSSGQEFDIHAEFCKSSFGFLQVRRTGVDVKQGREDDNNDL